MEGYNMPNMTPADLVAKARIKLCARHPFYGVLAMQMKMVADPTIPTLATDGERILYNPAYITELNGTDFQLVTAAIAHEVEHTARLHTLRCGTRDPATYNIAGDYLINLALIDSGFPLGAGWLRDDKYRGMTTDEIYDLIHKDQKKRNGQGQGQGQGQPGAGNPLGGHEGCCRQPQGSGPGGALTQGDIDRIEAQTKQHIAAAASVARMQGKLPGYLDTWIDSVLNPPERWQDILREFITNRARDDYSWSRPNRAHAGRGIILPSLNNYRMGQIVVALDSSGSCVHEFGQFLVNLNSILEDCRPALVTVIHCDADIAKVEDYTPEDLPIPNKLYGGGGTDFRPVFDYIEAHDIEPECLIYFTDTYGDFPNQEPGYPVLWAVTMGADRIPWGAVVEITA
jgi:predicted metal-dependent peptidase